MTQVVKSAVKLRVRPTPEIAKILDSQSQMCNWLYNHLLETATNLRASFCQEQEANVAKTLYTKTGLRNLVPAIKEKNPFLKSVHSSPLKNAALRLTDSIQTYQKSKKGKRKGKRCGWPGFRSWQRRWFSLLYDEPNKGFKLVGNILQLSLGVNEIGSRHRVEMVVEDSHLLQHKVLRNLRIVKQHKYYFAIFTIEQVLPEAKPIRNIIALDPNHKNLAYGVNTQGMGLEIDSPWWLKKFDKRLDELKAKRDKCKRKSTLIPVLDKHGNPTGKTRWRSSRRYQKLNQCLERLYAIRQEQTKVYCYTIANKLVQAHDLVVIGDYVPHGFGITTKMRRAMNNQSLIGRFKDALAWVALKSGKTYDEFNEKGTTRTCNRCHYVVAGGLAPHIRHWTCPGCQITHLRDENSAINGMYKCLRDLCKKSEVYASLVPSSGLG
jgi:putative transposase